MHSDNIKLAKVPGHVMDGGRTDSMNSDDLGDQLNLLLAPVVDQGKTSQTCEPFTRLMFS